MTKSSDVGLLSLKGCWHHLALIVGVSFLQVVFPSFLREVQVVNEDEDKIIMVFNDVQCSMVAEVVVLR